MKRFYFIFIFAFIFNSEISFSNSHENYGHLDAQEDQLYQQFQFFGESFSHTRFCRHKGIAVPDAAVPGHLTMTFDDGPNPETTPLVLDVLKAHKIQATFFVEGQNVRGHELILERMLREGHRIGNHSYTHPNFESLNFDQQKKQIDKTTAVIGPYFDPRSYFRFPYGNATCDSYDYLSSKQYRVVGWHIDTCDWAYADGRISDKERMICEIQNGEEKNFVTHVKRVAGVERGGIVLMHDVHHFTADHLNQLLNELESDGYLFADLADQSVSPVLNR